MSFVLKCKLNELFKNCKYKTPTNIYNKNNCYIKYLLHTSRIEME